MVHSYNFSLALLARSAGAEYQAISRHGGNTVEPLFHPHPGQFDSFSPCWTALSHAAFMLNMSLHTPRKEHALKTLVSATLSLAHLWNTWFVLGSISGFFTNLAGDVTAFALAASVFFFVWAAILFMATSDNDRSKAHAKGALYAALGGLALALLANTIAGLVNTAAAGQ